MPGNFSTVLELDESATSTSHFWIPAAVGEYVNLPGKKVKSIMVISEICNSARASTSVSRHQFRSHNAPFDAISLKHT